MKLLKAGLSCVALVLVVWAGGALLTANLASSKIDEVILLLNRQAAAAFNPLFTADGNDIAFVNYTRKDKGLFSEQGDLLLSYGVTGDIEKLPVFIDYGFLNASARVALTDKIKKQIAANFRSDFQLNSSSLAFNYSLFPEVYDLKVSLGGNYTSTPGKDPFSLFFTARLNMFDKVSFSFDAKNYASVNGERVGHAYFNSFSRRPFAYKNTAAFSGGIDDFDYAGTAYAKKMKFDFTLKAPDDENKADMAFRIFADELTDPFSKIDICGVIGKFDLLKLNFIQDAQGIEDFYEILCDNKLSLVLDGLSVVINAGGSEGASPEENDFAVLDGKGGAIFNLDDIDESQGDFEFKLDKMPEDALLSVVLNPFFVADGDAFRSKIVFSSGKLTVNGKRF